MNSTLIRGGTIVTMNQRRKVLVGDLLIRGDRIVEIGESLVAPTDADVIDARNTFVIPGLIQAHTHLCQALFRGLADDLELLDWLKQKIWPFEAAHSFESMTASAEIGLLEMQMLGTTSILDMASVKHTDAVFAAAEKSGIRYWGGNCLMDLKSSSGPLYLDTKKTLAECESLLKKWHQKTPLIEYAISPRFAISCSDKILKEVVSFQRSNDVLLHTHASENRSEVALVKKRSGVGNIEFLKRLELLNEKTVIAHGIHLSKKEVSQFISARAGLAHCPSSNLKLASGIAPIHDYLKMGMKVALGSDGAPCNNSMDPFLEMRLAALLQKPLVGPTALPAAMAFELATLGGARVLNVDKKVGSLENGKLADVVVVRRTHPSMATVEDPYSALVYSASGRDVRDVFTNGKCIVRDGRHQVFDVASTVAKAKAELSRLLKRIKK